MGESGRNGDANGPTTVNPRGDLPGYGDSLPGRATARPDHCRNPVLLVDRGGGSAVHLKMRDVFAVGDEWAAAETHSGTRARAAQRAATETA